ncbi:hypothetical protein Tco_0761953 [Tanacetum coccineum]
MTSFLLLHSHLKVLSIKGGFERACVALFDQDKQTFTESLLLNLEHLEKQHDREEFQETESINSFRVLMEQFQTFINFLYYFDDFDGAMIRKSFLEYTRTEIQQFRATLIQLMESVKKSIDARAQNKQEYDRRVNDRVMQSKEGKVESRTALDIGLVVTESNETESERHVSSSRSGKDTHAENANINSVNDQVPLVESKDVQIQEGKVDMESSGTMLDEQDTSSRSRNDADTEDAVIRPVNDQVSLVEVQLTTPHNVLVNEQHHSVQSEPSYDTHLLVRKRPRYLKEKKSVRCSALLSSKKDEKSSCILNHFIQLGNPVKKILLKLNLSDHRLFKDGGGVKEFQRSFRHSDTERLSRSDEVLKLKNFKKDATLKLFKSTNQEGSIAPTLVDLLPPRKRFKDSYSPEDSREKHMEIGMGVEIAASDIREDEEEFEAEASAGVMMEIVVGPLVTGNISESTRGDAPDLEGTLYDIVHYMSEVPLDRITEFETAQRQLEAGQLMASGERAGLTDRIRRLGRENLRIRALLYIERDRVDSLRHHIALSQEEFCQILRDRDDAPRRLRRLESFVERHLGFRP